MVDKELLEAISQMMDGKLKPISERLDSIEIRLDNMETRLDSMETRLGKLEEYSNITRSGVNSLLEWADECRNVVEFPLPKVK